MERETHATLPCDDPTRMGRLLARLEPRLRSVARRMTRNPDAAADVVKSAFEKVLRHCARFRARARASTWMHRIVVNEALMWLRRERRKAPERIHAEDWSLVFGRREDPAEQAAAREEQARLERAFRALPPSERTILREAVIRQRSYSEVARMLGLSPGAVKARVFRARRRIAREYGLEPARAEVRRHASTAANPSSVTA